MEPERLLEHIRQAATGQMTLSPQLTQILAQACGATTARRASTS